MTTLNFHFEFLSRLPLPLAQVYRRIIDAKEGQARHNLCYFAFEAAAKLLAIPLIKAYLDEVERSPGARRPNLDQRLRNLALPSQGHWLELLRELSRYFGERSDARQHPLGSLWDELTVHRTAPDLLELYRHIKNGPDANTPAGDQSFSLLKLFECLVQYRNIVRGHGAERFSVFYRKKSDQFLPALNELLHANLWDRLWPSGQLLIHIDDVRPGGGLEVDLLGRELTGERSVPIGPIRVVGQVSTDSVHRVALLWLERRTMLRLDPLAAFHPPTDAFEFWNADRRRRRIEYLNYTTGMVRSEADELRSGRRDLIQRIEGRPHVTDSDVARIVDLTLSDVEEIEQFVSEEVPTHRTLDDLEILAEIGRGGMGVVYLARQLSIGRSVALKMLPETLRHDEVALARFRREIRILGMCDHPNIVKILTQGETPTHDPYYTMEYVPGCDLGQLWSEIRLRPKAATDELVISDYTNSYVNASEQKSQSIRERAEQTVTFEPAVDSGGAGRVSSSLATAPSNAVLDFALPAIQPAIIARSEKGGYNRKVVQLMRDAALAVQYLHDRQIIHRDISPTNLMLTDDGNRIVLMDFGLAKGHSNVTQTETRSFLGKYRYAAPEQLAVATQSIGPQIDIRALGVTLWELLTRRRLFEEAQDVQQLTTLIFEQDVPKLRDVDPGFDKDLEAIVQRATERDPRYRLATAGELARHLDDYLDGRELTIRPRSAWESAVRWIDQHQSVAALTGGLAAAIVLGSVISGILFAKYQRQARNTELVFRQGLKATSDTFTFVTEDERLQHPSLSPIRKQLLTFAKDYYSGVAKLPDVRSADVVHRIALSNYQLGRIAIGGRDFVQAKSNLERALRYQNRITVSMDQRRELSEIVNALGDVSYQEAGNDTAQLEQALRFFEDARKIREGLPGSPENDRLLANSLMNIADIKRNMTDANERESDIQEPLELYEKSREIRQARSEAEIRKNSGNQLDRKSEGQDTLRRLFRDQAKNYINMAKLFNRPNPARARESLQLALEVCDGSLKQFPDYWEFLWLKAQAFKELAYLNSDNGDFSLAAANFLSARKTLDQVIISEIQAHSEKASLFIDEAEMYSTQTLPNHQKTKEAAETAIALLVELATLHNASFDEHFRRAMAYHFVGQAQNGLGDKTKAIEAFDSGIRVLEALSANPQINKTGDQQAELQDELEEIREARQRTNPR